MWSGRAPAYEYCGPNHARAVESGEFGLVACGLRFDGLIGAGRAPGFTLGSGRRALGAGVGPGGDPSSEQATGFGNALRRDSFEASQ